MYKLKYLSCDCSVKHFSWGYYKTYEICTKLGIRQIEFTVTDKFNNDNYALSYIDNGSIIFHIWANPDRTSIIPTLGEELMAKDIDLALYEVEQIIEEKYKYEIEKLNKHEREIHKLELGGSCE